MWLLCARSIYIRGGGDASTADSESAVTDLTDRANELLDDMDSGERSPAGLYRSYKNATGYMGVFTVANRDGKFKISFQGKELGGFSSPVQAAVMYKRLADKELTIDAAKAEMHELREAAAAKAKKERAARAAKEKQGQQLRA